MTQQRYRLDPGAELHGNVLIGGSPLKLFRLTEAGRTVIDRLNSDDLVAKSALVDRLLDSGAIHPVTEPADSKYTTNDVTVVAPVFNSAPPPLDGAIVVDDGSTPCVAGATVRLATNQGPAAARNAGLELVETPLVAFVDADVEVSPGWLDSLTPYFDDELVAVVAPRVVSSAGTSMLERYEAHHSPLDLGSEDARVRAGSKVSYLPAAALVCRTEALRSVGGFDVALRWGEDVDLIWRLDDAGWRVRYAPAVSVTHRPRATWSEWWRQRVGYGESSAVLARRHPGALAPLRLSGWSISAWLLGAARRPVLGAAVGVGSAAALARKLPDIPSRAAFRLAARGNAHAGEQIAQAVRRAWWPMFAVAALRSRLARRVVIGAVVAAGSPIRVADDLAFSVGVWRGMLQQRTLAPIVPEISSWPGRQARSRSQDAR